MKMEETTGQSSGSMLLRRSKSRWLRVRSPEHGSSVWRVKPSIELSRRIGQLKTSLRDSGGTLERWKRGP